MISLKARLSLLFSLLSYLLPGQVQDNFSDGNFTQNPIWQGDVSHFQVNTALELQLNAPAAGISSLFVPTIIADSAKWELYLRLEFDPSASNRLRVYLQSDNDNLTAGNGYYLLIGEDGTGDAIRFYRQNAGTHTLLASTAPGSVASSPEVRIRMTKEAGGKWKLGTDYTSGGNFVSQFEVHDATFGGSSAFFGFQCEYTSTRKDKFFFDDILVAPLLPDTDPPALLSAKAISALEVDVIFNEPIDETSAETALNFSVNNGIGAPLEAMLDATDPTLIHLSLAKPLVSGTNYTLTVAGLVDLAGNASAAQTANFSYLEIATAAAFDILINEIMADPSPPVGLPQVEFIELYNRSDKVIDLNCFGFSSGGTPQKFPPYLFLPGKYVIVCDDSNVNLLSTFGEVIQLPTFPALTNEADELTLTNAAGEVIHFVSYTLDTYKDNQKKDGGWTLELINPSSPCEGDANWKASVHLLGGTPGTPNSVLSAVPDTKSPDLLQVFATAGQPATVQLFFSEGLNRASAINPSHYAITNGISISSASISSPLNDAVTLQLAAPPQKGVIYEVLVSHDVTDCSGNQIGLFDRLKFGLPELVEPLDIVINEILFDPVTGGSDFLELYNRSGKIFNLADLIVGNFLADTVVAQVSQNRLFFPGEFVVLTPSPADIRNRYTVENEAVLLSNGLPGFKDDEGNVTIFRGNGTDALIIDAFDYSNDFHHPLLDDKEGVSLERINPDAPTQSKANWHSAASSAGFATPTYQNSQFFGNQQITEDIFSIPEPTFSPDDDGFEDFLLIQYQTGKPGYTARAKIFDAQGRQVKLLANNELLDAKGALKWEGDVDRGGKARLGIYMVWIQLFDPDGSVKEFKKTCVVAGKL
jgi:hypothetical protein